MMRATLPLLLLISLSTLAGDNSTPDWVKAELNSTSGEVSTEFVNDYTSKGWPATQEEWVTQHGKNLHDSYQDLTETLASLRVQAEELQYAKILAYSPDSDRGGWEIVSRFVGTL